MRRVSQFIVRHRLFILLLFIGITGFLFYHAVQLPVRISLEKFFPYDHPFVKLNKDLGSKFGGTNTMLIMVKSKQGSIYSPKMIDGIKKTTEYFYYKDYSLRSLAASLTLSKSKYTLGQGMGEIKMAPVFPPDFDNTQTSFEFAKKMVSQSPVFHGLLVSDDSTAALIIVEVDETKLNYNDFRKDLLAIKNTIESDGSISLAFAGRPVLLSWIYDLSKNIYLIIGIVGILCLIILFYFFRDIYGVIAVSLVAVCCAVWGLGCMSLLHFELSPLMLILPVLISTRAISHSIQLHSRFAEECDAAGGDRLVSLDRTFYSMLIPNVSAVFTDALGFFILYLINITLLQEVAISMGIWILTLVPLSGIMMPILCTYLPYRGKRKSPSNAIFDWGKISQRIGTFSMKRTGTVFIAVAVAVLLVFSLFYARKIQVGDVYPGSSILFPNSVYNQDTKKINDTFSKAGADGLTLFFQGGNDAIKKPETLKYLDRFERYMVENIDAASGAWSLVTALKNINMEIHDGDPKWSMIPDDELLAANLMLLFSSKNEPSEFARYTDPQYEIGNTVVFFKNHIPSTIDRANKVANEFFKTNPLESKYGRFYFAGGSIGLEMAVNQVVESSHAKIDLLILFTVLITCIISYRSFVGGFLLVIPLVFANLFVTAVMAFMGVGITIDTLPVVAIGVGIGVDFGIYMFSRVKEEMAKNGNNFDSAINEALFTTGTAILFSGLTMIVPLLFVGAYTEIKFQAQMSILIGVILFINMLWAITVHPIMIHYFRPNFLKVSMKSKIICEDATAPLNLT